MTSSARSTGLDGRPDHAGLRAGRRRRRARHRWSLGGWLPTWSPWRARPGGLADPVARQLTRPGPRQRLRPVPPGASCRGTAPLRPDAGSGRGRLRKAGGGDPHAHPGAHRGRDRRRAGARLGHGRQLRTTPWPRTTSTAGWVRSPPGPTRCSATASASGSSDCRANRASTPTSHSPKSSALPATGTVASGDFRQEGLLRPRGHRGGRDGLMATRSS